MGVTTLFLEGDKAFFSFVNVLNALARLRPACERFNSREVNYALGRLPTRGLKKARFWSLMAEVVSLLKYGAGITLRRKDLAWCPTAFRRL